MFPPIPAWDAVHPLVVHFPIALFFVAPLLLLVGLVLRREGRGFYVGALLLMMIGMIATWVAIETGEEAAELADRTPAVASAIERHEELAETTQVAFTTLTILFAAMLVVPVALKKPVKRTVSTVACVAFLVAYLVCTSFLARTAHAGGLLVHEHGVHAMLPLGIEDDD